jgi:SAM-dependent methyltransferase
VLDLAPSSLAIARRRLGGRAGKVTWIVGDVLAAPLAPSACGVWHDRAVFHFLLDPAERARYVEQVRRTVRPGGHVIVAGFAPDGPSRCSGLEVARHSPAFIHAELGADFTLLSSERDDHRTPSGTVQPFVYCLWRLEA